MKLIRFGEPGREDPGVLLENGRRVDASGEFHDYDEGFFASGGLDALAEWVKEGCPGAREADAHERLGPPVARPSKIVCIGKNYRDHALEMGGELPTDPVMFMKATTAWSGPNDEVILPPNSTKLDYEVELAVVIGQTASRIDKGDAFTHIAGYSTFCDYSERSHQLELGGQWTKGKSADSFAPMGPYLVTTDEIPEPQQLHLWCKVNQEIRQNSWTKDMMFTVPRLVSEVSQFMTLLPGDVIATGTPSGVAMGMENPRFLQAGDMVECCIEGIGSLTQRVIAG